MKATAPTHSRHFLWAGCSRGMQKLSLPKTSLSSSSSLAGVSLTNFRSLFRHQKNRIASLIPAAEWELFSTAFVQFLAAQLASHLPDL